VFRGNFPILAERKLQFWRKGNPERTRRELWLPCLLADSLKFCTVRSHQRHRFQRRKASNVERKISVAYLFHGQQHIDANNIAELKKNDTDKNGASEISSSNYKKFVVGFDFVVIVGVRALLRFQCEMAATSTRHNSISGDASAVENIDTKRWRTDQRFKQRKGFQKAQKANRAMVSLLQTEIQKNYSNRRPVRVACSCSDPF
jgi:hypothetical protein